MMPLLCVEMLEERKDCTYIKPKRMTMNAVNSLHTVYLSAATTLPTCSVLSRYVDRLL